jgi:hypothetical protein
MWFFFSCNYIKIPCGIFWGLLLFLFLFTHSLIVPGSIVLIDSLLHPSCSFFFWCLILTNSCSLSLSMETDG